jgi:hypothetical protein
VIDLRPWTEVTLDAIVETIRAVLTDAGIRTLTWDHPPSDPTQSSTPEAQILINRLERLYPHPSEASASVSGGVVVEAPNHMDDHGAEVRQVVGEMAALITALSPALKRCAADLETSGTDAELVDKLLKGADVMRDSGYMYLTWARYYAALSEGRLDAADGADQSEIGL